MSRFKKHIRKANDVGENNDLLSSTSVPKSILQQARKTGQLNLSNRDFKEVPNEVWKLNAPPVEGDADFGSSSRENWWDQVELTKLILASNNLTMLSNSISVFSSLVVLDLHDNKLTDLPNAIADLAVMEKLDISHNQLRRLPEKMSCLERLVTILLQHNQFSSLPPDMGSLMNLCVLDASHNQINSLPKNMNQLANLQKLNLSNNQIVNLPEEICCLPLLSYLDLNYNSLTSVPENWGKLVSLKELYLRNNSFSNLPDLRGCVALKEVYCASNKISSFDASKLPLSLVILELRDNKIEKVTDAIVDMKDLQRLDLANNNISTLPPKMGLMDHIKALNVEGNPMRGIRRDIINKGTLAIIKYLRTRIATEDVNGGTNGSSTPQSSLPISSEVAERSKIHALSATKTLDVSNKPWSEKLLDNCREIPLEVINMSKMGLMQLPKEISAFRDSLRTLNVSMNKLNQVGSEIGGFLSLTHLNLSTNALTDLPEELSNLKNLLELNIMQNRFAAIPKCVYSLENLEHLLAGGNQIAKIEVDELRKLTRLSTLALQNNSIGQVPPELSLISTLKNLQLEGNVFRIPRHNVLMQGTQAVLDYLKGRLPMS